MNSHGCIDHRHSKKAHRVPSDEYLSLVWCSVPVRELNLLKVEIKLVNLTFCGCDHVIVVDNADCQSHQIKCSEMRRFI